MPVGSDLMMRYVRYLLLLLIVLSSLCAPALGREGSPGELEIFRLRGRPKRLIDRREKG